MPTPNEVTVDFSNYRLKISKLDGVIRSRLRDGLSEAAELVRNRAVELAPKHVGDFIQIGEMSITESKGLVGLFKKLTGGNVAAGFRVFVKLSDAPDAAAWEYGSGLHRTKTPPDYVSIVAKNVPNLVFWWEKKGKWFVGPWLPIGHPGIVARPYLQPALNESKEEIKSIIQNHLAGIGYDL